MFGVFLSDEGKVKPYLDIIANLYDGLNALTESVQSWIYRTFYWIVQPFLVTAATLFNIVMSWYNATLFSQLFRVTQVRPREGTVAALREQMDPRWMLRRRISISLRAMSFLERAVYVLALALANIAYVINYKHLVEVYGW